MDCGPDWTSAHILAALQKGPHFSAKSREAVEALRKETAEKVKNGFARVIKWKEIKKNIPEKLKLSPVAMIPHKSRMFRAILDLSFRLRHNGHQLQSVNSTTKEQAPRQSMSQLGKVLKRIVAQLADGAENDTKFLFAKLDIKDGFWRLAVSNDDAWNFCYVLPTVQKPGNMDEVEIVVPKALQMGWCESPPLFCASSETARDVIQSMLGQPTLTAHTFENYMLTDRTETASSSTPRNAATMVEVYMDDYIGLTNDQSLPHLTKVSRAMLHGIQSIFPPPHISQHNGEDSISEKN